MEQNKAVPADGIKNMLIGKVEKSRTILEVFQYHNEQLTALVNTQYAPLTKCMKELNEYRYIRYVPSFHPGIQSLVYLNVDNKVSIR